MRKNIETCPSQAYFHQFLFDVLQSFRNFYPQVFWMQYSPLLIWNDTCQIMCQIMNLTANILTSKFTTVRKDLSIGPFLYKSIWLHLLKSSRNKKDLNNITAAPFSLPFSQCQQQKNTKKRGSCDFIKILLISWRL